VVKDINQPRGTTLFHLRRAAKLQIPVWTAGDLPEADFSKLGLKGSPTQVIKISSPPKREGVLDLIKADSVEHSAAILADKIIAEKIL
jgi:electron transfer flavoprotein beta subunit